MRRLLLIIWSLVAMIGQLIAQDVTYWVGKSSHPDPIMRHHEAFMEAFVKFHQQSLADTPAIESQHQKEHSDNSASNIQQGLGGGTCRIETISSVTDKGQETLTIAIGNGILVKYKCVSETIGFENETDKKAIYEESTLLKIEFEEDGKKSKHEYFRTNVIDKNNTNQNVKSNFTYCCDYGNVQK